MTPKDRSQLPYRPCVGVMLARADGQVFVGQRKDSEIAAWQMPQGGIDEGETPREAALRELWEETGVRADIVSVEAETPEWLTYDLPTELVGKVWNGRFRGQRQLWFLMRFQGVNSDIDIATEHEEFSAWRWMDAQAVLDNIVPFKRAVYMQVLTAFSDRL